MFKTLVNKAVIGVIRNSDKVNFTYNPVDFSEETFHLNFISTFTNIKNDEKYIASSSPFPFNSKHHLAIKSECIRDSDCNTVSTNGLANMQSFVLINRNVSHISCS